MCANVYGKRTPLDKALPTTWSHTRVWPLVGVNSVVTLKIGLPVEALQHRLVDDE